jgi:hypothetical protein
LLELCSCHLCDKFAPLWDLVIFNTLLDRQKLHHETLKCFHSIVYVTQTWLNMFERAQGETQFRYMTQTLQDLIWLQVLEKAGASPRGMKATMSSQIPQTSDGPWGTCTIPPPSDQCDPKVRSHVTLGRPYFGNTPLWGHYQT